MAIKNRKFNTSRKVFHIPISKKERKVLARKRKHYAVIEKAKEEAKEKRLLIIESEIAKTQKVARKKRKIPTAAKVIKYRKASFLKKYDLTPSEYADMLAKQGGVCKLCSRTNKNNRVLAVDHCHISGNTRALLCTRCNTMLGWADDNAETLEKAAQYLRIHQERAKIKLIG